MQRELLLGIRQKSLSSLKLPTYFLGAKILHKTERNLFKISLDLVEKLLKKMNENGLKPLWILLEKHPGVI